MAEKFIVEGLAGKRTLRGEVAVQGAKNAITKIIPAAILFEDDVHVDNVPAIEDVARLSELLVGLGCKVERGEGTLLIHPAKEWGSTLTKNIADRLRASIVLTGPLLARTGRAVFPFPGGDVFGERPIDLFLEGFKAMGATVDEHDDLFDVKALGKLRGAKIIFPFISVTATETLMLAAVLAEGTTILENAAMEPEIPALADYLNECGAHIEGAGSPTITIVGGNLLKAGGKVCHTPPDRLVTGSFVILAALAGNDISITKCEPAHVQVLLAHLIKDGVDIEVGKDFIRVKNSVEAAPYKSFSVRVHEYPGFPTDLQPLITLLLTQCEGEATLLETVFEGRFRYVDELVRMGADITVMNPHKLLIRGPRALSSAELESPDIRAGLTYLFAAAIATGTSTVNNAYIIDRGYEYIEKHLQKLGLKVTREQM